MKTLLPMARYRRDVKKLAKRGWNLEKLERIQELLQLEKPLPPQARSHKLTGEWLGFLECHIESDWLLIYDVSDTVVLLARTGTHADLFE